MKVIEVNQVQAASVDNPLFAGPVTAQTLFTSKTGAYFRVNQVNFGKGSRNKFHSHSTDQLLVVTAGKGICATETEQVTVGVGTVILFTAGEKHWHGATADSEFSHLAITPLDSKMTQLEK